MKKNILITTGFVTLMVASSIVSAITTSPANDRQLVPTVTPATAKLTQAAQQKQQTFDRLKAKGLTEIERRLNALNQLSYRVNEMQKLSAAQKTQLTAEIQSQITSLTTLKDKINMDTDIATLRTDVQSIITSYRIFALFIPEIRIIASADRILSVMDELTAWQTKLQTKVDEAKSKGFTSTTVDGYLAEISTKLSSASTNAQAALDIVAPLVPEDYPSNQAQLIEARGKIQAAIANLNDARQAAQKIVVELTQFANSFRLTPMVQP